MVISGEDVSCIALFGTLVGVSIISSIQYSYNRQYAEWMNDDRYDKSADLNIAKP